jgi:hypothetical protein
MSQSMTVCLGLFLRGVMYLSLYPKFSKGVLVKGFIKVFARFSKGFFRILGIQRFFKGFCKVFVGLSNSKCILNVFKKKSKEDILNIYKVSKNFLQLVTDHYGTVSYNFVKFTLVPSD